LSVQLKIIGKLEVESKRPKEALLALDRAANIANASSDVLSQRDMIEIQRYRTEAFLLLDELKGARTACQEGRVSAGRAAINESNRLFWELALSTIQMACAEVAAREGNGPIAIVEMADAARRLHDFAAKSPDNHKVRRELARADQRVSELRREFSPTGK
jgi:hypothetical protein